MSLKPGGYQLSTSTTDDAVCVGVLSLHNSKETKAILNAVEDLGHEPVWFRRENVAVSTEDGEVTVEPEVDITTNRLLLSNTEEPAELPGLVTTFNRIRPVLNKSDAVLAVTHEFVTVATLANRNIQAPDVLLALSNDRLNKGRERFGDVSVYKSIIGTHGGGTWKVDLTEPVNPRVGNRQVFFQRLINRGGDRHRDLHVYIVDGDIVGVMYRYAPEGDWWINAALGGDVLDAIDEMPDEARQTALYVAEMMEMDYVDVGLAEGDDDWFILEANPTVDFKGLYQATGKSPAPHIAKFIIERAGGEADETRVEELSATLDDSVPSCALNESPIVDGEAPLIGYIEKVVVNGTSGSQQTLTKSDTGVIRTSIDTSLAAEIDAESIKSMTRVKSGSLKNGRARPVVGLVTGIGGTQHTVIASVEDRLHIDYPLLLGRDILEHYRVDARRRANADRNDSDDEEEELLEE